MDITKTHTVKLTLVLTAEEADWLHSFVQNPHQVDNGFIEPALDREMRKKFFEATAL